MSYDLRDLPTGLYINVRFECPVCLVDGETDIRRLNCEGPLTYAVETCGNGEIERCCVSHALGQFLEAGEGLTFIPTHGYASGRVVLW